MEKAEAIAHFGSVGKLARAIGISSQAVYQWKKVPLKWQIIIQTLTNGALQAEMPQPTPVVPADPAQ
jgi:hypothetical protein